MIKRKWGRRQRKVWHSLLESFKANMSVTTAAAPQIPNGLPNLNSRNLTQASLHTTSCLKPRVREPWREPLEPGPRKAAP